MKVCRQSYRGSVEPLLLVLGDSLLFRSAVWRCDRNRKRRADCIYTTRESERSTKNPLQSESDWGIVVVQHRLCLVCRWCVHLRTRGGSCRSRLAAVFLFHLLLYTFFQKKQIATAPNGLAFCTIFSGIFWRCRALTNGENVFFVKVGDTPKHGRSFAVEHILPMFRKDRMAPPERARITEGRPKPVSPLLFVVRNRFKAANPWSLEAPELRSFQLPCSSIATCRAQRAALALVKYRTCFFSRLAWSMMR